MLKQITTALLMATAIMVNNVAFAETSVVNTASSQNPEIIKLEKQIIELEKMLDNYKNEQKSVEKDLSVVTRNIVIKQKELAELKERETNLNKTISSLNSKITATNTKIKDLKAQIERLLRQCTKNQYMANGKCTTCPKYATCDGKAAKCASGYAQATNKTTGEVICQKIAKKCEQGSHDSTAWIKAHYKNCTSCRTEQIPAGKCSKNKKPHNHYYCMCDC